jgi:hypothetical protein
LIGGFDDKALVSGMLCNFRSNPKPFRLECLALGVILITRTDRGGDAGRNLGERIRLRRHGAVVGMHR